MSKKREREYERTYRLLRRLDLDEVLEVLGLEVLYHRGTDAYVECPDPDHDDANPSCHVCVEDVADPDGRSRLGSFNCWSHPNDEFRSRDFLNLVARVLFEIWGVDADGEVKFVKYEDRDRAAAWLRSEFLGREESVIDRRRDESVRRRRRREVDGNDELIWPPNEPIAVADPRCRIYLERRGISIERATELDVRGVVRAGDPLFRTLCRTVPGVLFPIRWDGRTISWFVRSIARNVAKGDKGRYAPRAKIAKLGAIWLPGVPDFGRALVLVEGVFDAERVRRVIIEEGLDLHPENVGATLGGRLTEEQARRLRVFPRFLHLSDGDAGGQTLSKSILKQLDRHGSVEVRSLPPGTDPDDAPRSELIGALTKTSESPTIGRRYRRAVRRE